MTEGGHKVGYKDTSKIHKPIVIKKSNSLSNAAPILEPRNIADFLPKVTARSNPSIDPGLSEADSIELLKKQVFDRLSKIIGESNTVDILTAVSRTPIEGEEIWDSIDSMVAEATSAEQYFNIRIDFNRLRELYLFPSLKSKVEPTSQKDILDKENPIVQGLSYIWNTVIGDWNNQQDPLQILANVGVGLIPVVDQVLDFRDFTAHLYYMVFQKDYKDPMRWLGLGLTAIGAIPLAGSIAKGLGKLALSSDVGKAIKLYAEPLLIQIRQINPEWEDISKLKAVINENWGAGVAASKEVWMYLLSSAKDKINGLLLPPEFFWGADKLASAKQELLSTITEIENLSNSMLDEALEAIKSEIEFILDELNRVSQELLDKRKLEKPASSKTIEPEFTPVKSSENNIEPKDLFNHPDRSRQLEGVLTGDEKVPVIIDNSLTTNTVKIHYLKGEDGLVEANSIYITAGPSASSTDIMLHSRSVYRIKRYSGLLGKTIKLKNQLLELFFNIENPEIASKAWEAMLEVEKIEDIINYNMRQRSDMIDIRPEEEFKAEIENLETQLAKHRETYRALDESEGVGFIAVKGVERDYNALIQKIDLTVAENLKNTGKAYITKDELIEIAGFNRDVDPKTLTRNIHRLRKKITELDVTPKRTLYYNSEADVFSFSEEDILSAKVINRRKSRAFKNKKESTQIQIYQLKAISDAIQIKSKENSELSIKEISRILKEVENKYSANYEKIRASRETLEDFNIEEYLKLGTKEIENLLEEAKLKMNTTKGETDYVNRDVNKLIKEFPEEVKITEIKGEGYSFEKIDLEKLREIEVKLKDRGENKTERKRRGSRESSISSEDLREEFSKVLESGQLKEDVFELICGWRDVIDEWEKIDPTFNVSEIIKNYFNYNFTNTEKELRPYLRQKIADVLKSRPVEERLNTLNQFRNVLPIKDSKLKGELFTTFRRSSLEGNLLPGVQLIDGDLSKTLEDFVDADKANQAAKEAGLLEPQKGKRYVDLGEHITKPQKRYVLVKDKQKSQIDDFIEVKEQTNKKHPGLGKYLVEDKGGARAFQIEQAKIYSAHIMKGKDRTIKTQNLVTKEGAEYDGVVYFFENEKFAIKAIEKLDKIEAYREGYIHLAFFDKTGKIKWSVSEYQSN